MRRALPLTLLLLASPTVLQGCAGIFIAGAASTALSVHDRRTLGNQIDDEGIELKANRQLTLHDALGDHSRAVVVSYNGIVLLVGETPTEEHHRQIKDLVGNVDGVRQLHDQMTIGNPISAGRISKDAWLTTKIKAKLLASDGVDSTHVKVYTENATVYLLGLVSNKEADTAVEIARNVDGVKEVVKVFEYINPSDNT